MGSIRRSKTDQEAKANCGPARRRSFCPVRLLREWLDAAGIIEGALFRQVPKERVNSRAHYDVIKSSIDRARRWQVRQPFHAVGLDLDGGDASNEIHVLSADVRLDARGEDNFYRWRTGSNATTRYGSCRGNLDMCGGPYNTVVLIGSSGSRWRPKPAL
jgi:hypothetical protein